MGRRNRQPGQHSDATDWASERTLADVETEKSDRGDVPETATETRCACGSPDFLLEAYLHVADGVVEHKPVEVSRLSCPECGREYEAILTEGGTVVRGEFLGFVEADDAE